MNTMLRTALLILPLCATLTGIAQEEKDQCHHADNKKAIDYYEKGIDTRKYKREERLAFFDKALELDPDYVEVYFKRAMVNVTLSNLHQGDYKPSRADFLKVIELCPGFHSDPYYYVGYSFYEEENYPEAIKYLQKYIDFKDDDVKKYNKDFEFFLENSGKMIKYAKIYDDLKKNIVPFDPKPVSGVCTEKDEYLAIITPDDEQMFYVRRGKENTIGEVIQSDKLKERFMFSVRDKSGKFDSGTRMPNPFNTFDNQGAATVSIDNKHLIFTIGKDEGGDQPNFDLYYSDKVDGTWGPIKNCGAPLNDPKYWDSQPSLSSDGTTLYFASDRPGGFGGSDIWVSHRKKDGTWENPVNCGPKINTRGEEKTPFIHSDSETLYFSSDGLPGAGGEDIFLVRKNDKGEWEDPKNIGIPINTAGDEVGFFVSTDGHYGYFASNLPQKNPGMGGYDVYSFELYEKARPQEVGFIRGQTKNEAGESPGAVSIEIKGASSKTKTQVVLDTVTGQYSAIVNKKKKEDYIITVKKKGAAFSSQLVSSDSVCSRPVKKYDMDVKAVATGTPYTLNNIYYKVNSAELDSRSKIVLEEFAHYLKENPNIRIEIHGHTDNVGDAGKNLGLSTDRALTVFETLESLGVKKEQLVAYKGFGSTKPLADNNTEAGRAKNRRTEFYIVGK